MSNWKERCLDTPLEVIIVLVSGLLGKAACWALPVADPPGAPVAGGEG